MKLYEPYYSAYRSDSSRELRYMVLEDYLYPTNKWIVGTAIEYFILLFKLHSTIKDKIEIVVFKNILTQDKITHFLNNLTLHSGLYVLDSNSYYKLIGKRKPIYTAWLIKNKYSYDKKQITVSKHSPYELKKSCYFHI